MLIDTNELPAGTVIRADLCIAGAGAAGISLARQLSGGMASVCLLEGGGVEFDPKSQNLYHGMAAAPMHAAYLYTSRLRYLGGTTNHWLGACRPLDEIDLAPRPWVPDSGWPITFQELQPFYRGAAELCEVAADFAPGIPLVEDGSSPIRIVPFHIGPPTRFGQSYRKELIAARNLSLYLHANVLRVVLRENGVSVKHLEVARDDGERLRVEARFYVLALGGIENSRLLLVSDNVNPKGVGNDRDLVGRYFMDHPVFPVATVATSRPDTVLTQSLNRSTKEWHTYRLSDEKQGRLGLLNCGLGVDVVGRVDDPRQDQLVGGTYRAAAQFLEQHAVFEHSAFLEQLEDRAKTASDGLFLRQFEIRPEQAPNPDSRITLANSTDAFGLRQATVIWRLSELDWKTLSESARVLGEELGKYGLGRLRLASPGPLEQSCVPGFHHMGGTRMHDDPARGVVDHQAKVHGIANLFIAGSSVFPTSGYANPTLTLVALALRLAEHLKTLSEAS